MDNGHAPGPAGAAQSGDVGSHGADHPSAGSAGDGIAEQLGRLEFWSRPLTERAEAFARMRAIGHPVYVPGPPVAFHALTRHAEVLEASRNPRLFSSEPTSVSLHDPAPAEADLRGSMISLDDPRHARLRRIVSRAFTPRRIKAIEDDVTVVARRIVADLARRGPCDFVTEVAMPLPLEIICSMMGIPASAHAEVIDATNVILALGDPDHVPPDGRNRQEVVVEKLSYLHNLMDDLAGHRRAHPADDLITGLVNANVDGEALTARELGRFFALLVVAGNETTRNAISHGLALFTANPAQRAALLADLEGRLPGAVEEVIRCATPVTWMRRTVTQDTELLGYPLQKGDKVILYYNSANRDETVFTEPETFDISRDPNPHVGFGAAGPHFCLGAHLARHEIRVMFRELFTRLPDIHAAEPVYQRSSFINGVRQLPCAFSA